MAENGDWVEGEVKWWWKYVFPSQASIFTEVLRNQGTVSQTWLRTATNGVLEGLIMLHASARADEAVGDRLRSEGVAKIHQAVAHIARIELEQR